MLWKQSMKRARTIIALVIAASVALLPVAGAAAPAAQAMDMAVAMAMPAADEIAVAHDMSDCCPPAAAPCEQAMGPGACMAACASNVFSFSNGGFSDLVFPLVRAQILPSLARQSFRAQTGSPPFRPPRV
jgi:hypothetical protein